MEHIECIHVLYCCDANHTKRKKRRTFELEKRDQLSPDTSRIHRRNKIKEEMVAVARNKLARSRHIKHDEKQQRRHRMMNQSPTSANSSKEFS
ncbi:hypothetical protein PR048_008974 [Dryococelus australis]|uniref:Uncharacterized protein n=1 Tax=Dryococelus australis TaxID=614101 RepID=A0ABQ9HYL3_9NEOP|nr:hypothetical protein PR048_008974 [Dryococelus australis]